MPTKTFKIEYNEERNIHHHLDLYGDDILYAYTRHDTTPAEAIRLMKKWYGDVPVDRWVNRNPLVKKMLKEDIFYA